MSADWLNYHHLLYFWTVVREGSISKACDKLSLAQPTISGQLRKLEQTLGGKLFDRAGRELVMTELGQMVYRYAEEIFTTGNELMDAVRGRPTGRPLRLVVGIPGVISKTVVYKLLSPVLDMSEKIHLVCREASQSELLQMLVSHELDVVLSDVPAGSLLQVRAFNHSLGTSPVGWFGTAALVQQCRESFPQCMQSMPCLLPAESTTLRRSVDHWCYENSLSLNSIGEFDDTALMKVFASAGRGLIPLPMVVEKEVREQMGLYLLGVISGATEDFYAISVERKISHPGVAMFSEVARRQLYGDTKVTEVAPLDTDSGFIDDRFL
ncbi:MAG: transcriptional activator NhaR [Planctomycetota bacterium]|jgi:LysR family transcriptional activator of nhaA|nr:MAG: transcriptional activator NhaR [Planctomycetota bacterium]